MYLGVGKGEGSVNFNLDQERKQNSWIPVRPRVLKTYVRKGILGKGKEKQIH